MDSDTARDKAACRRETACLDVCGIEGRECRQAAKGTREVVKPTRREGGNLQTRVWQMTWPDVKEESRRDKLKTPIEVSDAMRIAWLLKGIK